NGFSVYSAVDQISSKKAMAILSRKLLVCIINQPRNCRGSQLIAHHFGGVTDRWILTAPLGIIATGNQLKNRFAMAVDGVDVPPLIDRRPKGINSPIGGLFNPASIGAEPKCIA